MPRRVTGAPSPNCHWPQADCPQTRAERQKRVFGAGCGGRPGPDGTAAGQTVRGVSVFADVLVSGWCVWCQDQSGTWWRQLRSRGESRPWQAIVEIDEPAYGPYEQRKGSWQ
jgi:hypothetical protein